MTEWSSKLEQAGISERYHKWLYVALALLLVRFVLMPLLDWQQEKIESIEFNQLQTRDVDTINEMREALNDNIAQLTEQLQRVSDFYIKVDKAQQAEIEFAQTIEKLAVDAGLKVGSKSWQTLFSTDWYTRQKMDVQLEGNFKQLQEFVLALESSRSPIYLVVDTNISSKRLRAQIDVRMEIHQLVLVNSAAQSSSQGGSRE